MLKHMLASGSVNERGRERGVGVCGGEVDVVEVNLRVIRASKKKTFVVQTSVAFKN